MSVNEIIQKIHELSPEDQEIIRRELDSVGWANDMTPEMIAAVEEGLRSSREEPHCTIEDLEEDLRKWNSGSKITPQARRTSTLFGVLSRLTAHRMPMTFAASCWQRPVP